MEKGISLELNVTPEPRLECLQPHGQFQVDWPALHDSDLHPAVHSGPPSPSLRVSFLTLRPLQPPLPSEDLSQFTEHLHTAHLI